MPPADAELKLVLGSAGASPSLSNTHLGPLHSKDQHDPLPQRTAPAGHKACDSTGAALGGPSRDFINAAFHRNSGRSNWLIIRPILRTSTSDGGCDRSPWQPPLRTRFRTSFLNQ